MIQFVHIHHVLDECVYMCVQGHVQPSEHAYCDNFYSAFDAVAARVSVSFSLVCPRHNRQHDVGDPHFVLEKLFPFDLASSEVIGCV